MAIALRSTRQQSAQQNSTTTTTIPLTYPAVIADGDVILLAVTGYAQNSTSVQHSTPAGWVLVGTAGAPGAQQWLRTSVYRRAGLASLAGTSFNFTQNAGGTIMWISNFVVYSAAGQVPRNAGFVAVTTGTTTFTVPDVGGYVPGDTVLQLISVGEADRASTNSAANTIKTTDTSAPIVAQRASGGSIFPDCASAWAESTVGGSHIYTNTQSAYGVLAQVVLQPAVVYAFSHPGGTLTGYASIFTRTTGTKKLTDGRGGQLTGYAQLAGSGVKKLRPPEVHQGRITAEAVLSPGRGVYKRKVPHYRTGVTATTDSGTGLQLLIPPGTRPTDLIFVEVAYGDTGGAVETPAGFDVLDTGVLDDGSQAATFVRSAGRGDAGTTVTVTVTGPAAQLTGLLAVYTPGQVDSTATTTQNAGSTRMLFGPGAEDPGTLRVALGAARATDGGGEQLAFTKPLSVQPGATATTPKAQVESDRGQSVGVVLTDYTGTTSLLGQLSAAVPVRARIAVADIEGVEYHEGGITGRGGFGRGGGQGFKDVTDGAGQYTQIVGHDGSVFHGGGAHSDIGARGTPGVIVGEGRIVLYPGLIYDSYRGGRIDMQAQLRAGGNGAHTGTGEMVGKAVIRVRRGAQIASHPGAPITGYVELTGAGRRTWMHPGGRITGEAVLRGVSGSTRVNVIKGWAQLLAPGHTGDHTDNDLSGTTRPGRIDGDAVIAGKGVPFALVDERYTQIRGVAVLYGTGHPGPPNHIGSGGTIVGVAVLAAADLSPREPEELTLEITLGGLRVISDRGPSPEDFELEIELGPVVVSRLVPGQLFASRVRYGTGAGAPRRGVVHRSEPGHRGTVHRSEPGYPFTTGR